MFEVVTQNARVFGTPQVTVRQAKSNVTVSFLADKDGVRLITQAKVRDGRRVKTIQRTFILAYNGDVCGVHEA